MTGEPFSILLVEDNDADVYLLRKALESAGLHFELTVVEDGGTALEFVRGDGKYAGNASPHLAIIDLSLPKNDGIQILEAIRAAKRFAGMPIIIMSSAARPPARLREEHLRVARYISKPPDLEGFFQTGFVIKELLESQARRAGQ